MEISSVINALLGRQKLMIALAMPAQPRSGHSQTLRVQVVWQSVQQELSRKMERRAFFVKRDDGALHEMQHPRVRASRAPLERNQEVPVHFT